MAVWLRPSKQIRAPLYSIKQKRQRRWIIVKYGIVYIIAFAIFAALIAVREYPPSVLPALCDVLTMCCAHSRSIPRASHVQLQHLPGHLMDHSHDLITHISSSSSYID